jgi:hypothetical protein
MLILESNTMTPFCAKGVTESSSDSNRERATMTARLDSIGGQLEVANEAGESLQIELATCRSQLELLEKDKVCDVAECDVCVT